MNVNVGISIDPKRAVIVSAGTGQKIRARMVSSRSRGSVENYRVHATHVLALGTAAKRLAPMGRPQVEHIP
jgi:hypothetical protein